MKKADGDAHLLREFDFSGAIRGRYAHLWNAEQREEFLRSAPFDDADCWIAHLRTAFEGVAAALFAYRVIAEGEPAFRAAGRSAALEAPAGAFRGRLAKLRAERDSIAPPPGDADRSARLAWVERMGRLLSDARRTRDELEEAVRARLAADGLAPPAIERRRRATERLRRAA